MKNQHSLISYGLFALAVFALALPFRPARAEDVQTDSDLQAQAKKSEQEEAQAAAQKKIDDDARAAAEKKIETDARAAAPATASVAPAPPAPPPPPMSPAAKIGKRPEPAKSAAKPEMKQAETKTGDQIAETKTDAARQSLPPATPPSLAPSALCDELRRASRDRKEERARIADERAEVAKQRAELQALADSIAQARKDLREETARLQALIDKVPDKAGGGGRTAKTAGGR